MQRLRILVILILLSLMPLYSLAVLNEGQYAFRSLDINNGLSQNTVHAILQDKQGFMWFGTKDGLDRYDGISFRTFMKESGTLGNNFITSLYEDNLGQIWIGTDVGLYVYCPQMEKVRHYYIFVLSISISITSNTLDVLRLFTIRVANTILFSAIHLFACLTATSLLYPSGIKAPRSL